MLMSKASCFVRFSRDWCGTCPDDYLNAPDSALLGPHPPSDVPYPLLSGTVLPYGCPRWPTHTATKPVQDDRNVHKTRSHGPDLLPLSPRCVTCLSFFPSCIYNLNPPQLSPSPQSRKGFAISTSPLSSSLSESTLAQVCSASRISSPPINSLKGVILSTAFVHLLQDAFDRLQDPQVKQYTNIGRWTGLIVQVQSLIGLPTDNS